MLAWIALFWRLGEPTFWDPDEAHYAVTTRELLTSGDWLAPTYNGEPFFDKPVLFHQLQAVSMRVAGPNELGARLVPALSALALIGVTWWLGRTLGTPDVAWAAALLLTTSPAIVALARYAILDLLFTAFLFGGAAVVTVSALRERPQLQYLGYVLVALAVLTKGPLGLALTGLTFLAVILLSREVRQRLLALHWVVGMLLIVSIATPWFAYMSWRFGQAFVQGYVLNENLWLFATPQYTHQPGWTFYLRILAVGLLPWTPVLVGRLYDVGADLVQRRRRVDPLETLLWGWVTVTVAFFSASDFKLDHYVFPAAPALYLLCARAWVDAQVDAEAARHAGARAGFWCVGPLLIGAGAVIAVLLWTRLALPRGVWILPAVWVGLGVVLTRSGRARVDRAPWITATAFGALYAVAVLYVVPAIEQQKVVADLAHWITAHGDASPRVCSYRLNRWNNSLLFYVDRPVTMLDTAEEMRQWLREGGPFYCVMPQSAYDALRSDGVTLSILARRDGLWATSGRALWRSGATSTTFVVVGRASAAHTPRPSFGSVAVRRCHGGSDDAAGRAPEEPGGITPPATV